MRAAQPSSASAVAKWASWSDRSPEKTSATYASSTASASSRRCTVAGSMPASLNVSSMDFRLSSAAPTFDAPRRRCAKRPVRTVSGTAVPKLRFRPPEEYDGGPGESPLALRGAFDAETRPRRSSASSWLAEPRASMAQRCTTAPSAASSSRCRSPSVAARETSVGTRAFRAAATARRPETRHVSKSFSTSDPSRGVVSAERRRSCSWTQ
mmetsp:Transcript_16648/g.56245  ORF Transcript_16648/g.56245 Transcript_16648/m.56245 type:complete len:210 (-) Transcript_16648:885-1514(-)